MKAIIKEPGELPRVISIDNTLEALQGAVDGYIETVRFTTDCVIICNEEGLVRGLPYNFKWIENTWFGNILLVGVNKDKFCSLDDEQVNFLLRDIGEETLKQLQNEEIMKLFGGFENGKD